MKRILETLLGVAATYVLFTVVGCGGGGSTPDTTAPALQRVSATQSAAGSTVHIEADVSDAGGIATVTAVTTDTNGVQQRVPLVLTSGGTYAVDAPSNVVSVVVEVKDHAGNQTVSLESRVPPPPPF